MKEEEDTEANLGEDGGDPDDGSSTPPEIEYEDAGDENGDGEQNIQALLATCMNLSQNHPLARDAIADALGHLGV